MDFIFSSGDHFVHWSGTILAIMVEGLMRNICGTYFKCKLFRFCLKIVFLF